MYKTKITPRSIQHEVERRVVAQLALAHELGQLRQGCDVNFALDCQSQATNSFIFLKAPQHSDRHLETNSFAMQEAEPSLKMVISGGTAQAPLLPA